MSDQVNVDLIVKAIAEGFDKVGQDIASLGTQSKRASTGIDSITTSGEKSGSKIEALAGKVLKWASALGIGTLAMKAAKKAIDFMNESIDVASQSEETWNKFTVLFAEYTRDAAEELANFADVANRSKGNLYDMAAGMQSILVPMGFSKKEAADLSVELTKLAVDVASFNNMQDADVMKDFESAVVGLHQTVKKYGVVITEAMIDQELLNMGIEKTAIEADNVEKVMARLNIMQRALTDSQGDAIKTADSYENVMKGQKAAVTEFKSELGTELSPVVKEARKEYTGFIKTITKGVALQNALRAAVEDGVITERQMTEQLNLVQYAHKEVADAQEWVSQKYKESEDNVQDYNRAMDEHQSLIKAVQDQTMELTGSRTEAKPGDEDYRDIQKEVADALAEVNRETINAKANQLLLSETLKDADGADVARHMINGLIEEMSAHPEKAEEFAGQIRSIQDQFHLADTESRNLVTGMDALFTMLGDGSLSTEQIAEAFFYLNSHAGDTNFTVGDLVSKFDQTPQSVDAAKSSMEHLTNLLIDKTNEAVNTTRGHLEAVTALPHTQYFDIVVTTYYREEGEPSPTTNPFGDVGLGEMLNSIGFVQNDTETDVGGTNAVGGSFIVPPGLENDTGRIKVSSGEGVSVIPAPQMRGSGLGDTSEILQALEVLPRKIGREIRNQQLMGSGV